MYKAGDKVKLVFPGDTVYDAVILRPHETENRWWWTSIDGSEVCFHEDRFGLNG